MKMLVVGEHTQISREISRLISASSSSAEIILIDWTLSGDPSSLFDELLKHRPCYLVCVWTAFELPVDTRSQYEELLLSLASECKSQGCALICLGDYQVFDGIKNTPYLENDAFAPYSEFGKWSVRLEKELHNRLDELIIIRTGWVYGSVGDNYLSRMLCLAESGETLVFDPAVSSSPTSTVDIARVIFAIVQQLSVGANCWGVYHYCSSDVTSGYRFAEALIAIAGQYNPKLAEDRINLIEKQCFQDERLPVAPVIMSCQKLLNNFGIKQRPWKSGLTDIIKEYFIVKQSEEKN